MPSGCARTRMNSISITIFNDLKRIVIPREQRHRGISLAKGPTPRGCRPFSLSMARAWQPGTEDKRAKIKECVIDVDLANAIRKMANALDLKVPDGKLGFRCQNVVSL
jgi:hypothetical protein